MKLHHLSLALSLLVAAPALAEDTAPLAASTANLGDDAMQRLGVTAGGFVAQWALAAARADLLSADLDKLRKRLDVDEAELGYWRNWANGITAPSRSE